jgi:SOS response regulatory protein OraA/RecX
MNKKNKIEEEISKIFQRLEDENWISDSELSKRIYEISQRKENYEKMKRVSANRKFSISRMKKPKGIEEWCD